jgi:hypothetical protein
MNLIKATHKRHTQTPARYGHSAFLDVRNARPQGRSSNVRHYTGLQIFKQRFQSFGGSLLRKAHQIRSLPDYVLRSL